MCQLLSLTGSGLLPTVELPFCPSSQMRDKPYVIENPPVERDLAPREEAAGPHQSGLRAHEGAGH